MPLKEIAEAIGRGTGLAVRSVPEDEIPGYFSFLAGFITLDDPTSNAITREVVGWEPTHPGLIADYGRGPLLRVVPLRSPGTRSPGELDGPPNEPPRSS